MLESNKINLWYLLVSMYMMPVFRPKSWFLLFNVENELWKVYCLANYYCLILVYPVARPSVTKENHEVRSCKVADRTGCINISLWDEPGKLLQVKKAIVSFELTSYQLFRKKNLLKKCIIVSLKSTSYAINCFAKKSAQEMYYCFIGVNKLRIVSQKNLLRKCIYLHLINRIFRESLVILLAICPFNKWKLKLGVKIGL